MPSVNKDLKIQNNPSKVAEFVANPIALRAFVTVSLTMVLWIIWTKWSDAAWFHQALFILVFVTMLVLITKPKWVLHAMLFILIADVTERISEKTQIPGLVGLPGLGGNIKIPELISLLLVSYIAIYFCFYPERFKQPLVKQFGWFFMVGLFGTVIGVIRYNPTSALRDSLAYYFSIFFTIGMVLLHNNFEVKKTFRFFFYVSLFAVFICYIIFIATGSSGIFYPAIRGMMFSACAYFLFAKLFTTPLGARKWMTIVALVLFSMPMFIGRSRGSVLSFILGLIPLFIAMRPKERLKVIGGILVPCIALMVALFIIEGRAATLSGGGGSTRGAGGRGIEAFTKIGDARHDPTGSYRLHLWGLAIKGFFDSPIIGKGYGWTIPVWTKKSMFEEHRPAAIMHNSFLHILACGGIIGIFPLILIVSKFIKMSVREFRESNGEKRFWIACAMSIALNFFLTASTNVGFETVSGAVTGWLLFAVAVRFVQAPEDDFKRLIPRRYYRRYYRFQAN